MFPNLLGICLGAGVVTEMKKLFITANLEVIFDTIVDYDTLNKNIHLFVDPAWDPRKETPSKLNYVLLKIDRDLMRFYDK